MIRMSRVEQLRVKLLGTPPSQRLLGWLGPLFFTVVGGVLRFWDLGNPHQLVFDETYYVKEGWSMILFGYERRNDPVLDAAKQIDQNFTILPLPNEGRAVYGTEADFVVHPPLGKWLIGWGENLFGIDSSFGWRFSVCVLGTLSILMIGRVAYRMFHSWYLATLASGLLAVEGHHFVHSRTGLLDLIVMFFAFAAFAALLIDRDRSRALLARKVAALPPGLIKGGGPRLGLRPWRWVAGLLLGLAAGTKWSGLYFLVAFGLMTVFWDMGARRAAGIRNWWLGGVLTDGLYAAFAMVGGTLVAYLATWTGWFRSTDGYLRTWGETNNAGGLIGHLPAALQSLWKYHTDILDFHKNLSSDHPYKTNPWSWMVQGRPTSFFYEGPKLGEDGCTVTQCSKAITSVGTVSIWWTATLLVFVLVFMWAFRRDWRAGAILAGYAGGYLPWFFIQDRTIYSFYTVAFVPFVVLTCVYGVALVFGGPDAPAERRRAGYLVGGAFLVLSIAIFAFFYPVYTAQVIPQDQWGWRMWFRSWV